MQGWQIMPLINHSHCEPSILVKHTLTLVCRSTIGGLAVFSAALLHQWWLSFFCAVLEPTEKVLQKKLGHHWWSRSAMKKASRLMVSLGVIVWRCFHWECFCAAKVLVWTRINDWLITGINNDNNGFGYVIRMIIK